MKTHTTSVKNVVLFSVMETDYSTTLINVCSETSLQQKLIQTAVNNVVLFSVMETEPTSVKNVVLFFSYRDRLLNPFNFCSSMVSFNTIYSIDLPSLYSAAEKDE